MSETETTDLVMSSRLYSLIKSTAVTNVSQAFVELITNSNDAYKNVENRDSHLYKIYANYKDRYIKVVDNATGITSENMIKYFGQVGEYTASSSSRGYFSRGAKDITALGDATFTSIKDGLVNQLTLLTNDKYTLNKINVPVTDADREKYEMDENGLCVELKIKDSVLFVLETDKLYNLSHHFALRDIFEDNKNYINLHVTSTDNTVIIDERKQYIFPEIEEEPLIDVELKIEGYEGVTATFKLYKLKNPVSFEDRYDNSEHSILISDGKTIHERTTFYTALESHPMVTQVVGRLNCPYISELMHKYDLNPDDPLNPFPVVDHSRLYGLNRKHPFTRNLLRHPFKMLQFVLDDLYDKSIQETQVSDSVSHLFNNVELFGTDFFKKMLENVYGYKQTSSKSSYIGYLTKNRDNIISSGDIDDTTTNTQYDFKQNFNKVDPPGGDIKAEDPSFTINFTDKDYNNFSYIIYRMGNIITLDINIADYLVSKYIRRKQSGGGVEFIDEAGGNVVIIDIICEALSREVIKEREVSGLSTMSSSEEMFTSMEKIRDMILPQVYTLVKSNSITFAS